VEGIMNFYAVLGIRPDADQETIRSAYRILARRYHPDSGSGSSTEKFRQVTEAYETLIDAARRELYDLSCLQPHRPAPVRVEPMTAPPEFVYQDRPDLFGRSATEPFGAPSRMSHGFNELVDAWIRSLEDDLFFSGLWRW
jgi:curved DNA-binding protein CbpA